MNFTQSQDNQKIMNDLINKCWEDENFKKELIANPTKTLEKFLGKPLNNKKGIKLVVNDQTDPSFIHINIPQNQKFDDIELTDDQLEAVAGGWELFGTFICVTDTKPKTQS
ncbi:NHLP leader peptide family RiPP precursor [Polaribacter cellanae]|uniref:NHLP leader peptide family RiPP n=1 Tax=Polaribacter cellanae TaxID=2818493 RepID=A0A975H9T3_9FLAO|nr:NHLP leader peptide family RiPP precursor [Polaribacter cellanae]QTE23310.1 NHLP leader peptide family RiPP precursor [Polaribacter cellanae]